MNTPETLKEQISKKIKVLQIICAAMLFADIILVFVCWVILTSGAADVEQSVGEFSIVAPMLMTVGVLVMALSWPLKFLLMKNLSSSDSEKSLDQIISKFVQTTIIIFNLRELVLIFGLISTLLTNNMVWVMWGFMFAVLAKLAGFPGKRDIEKYYSMGELYQPLES